MIGTALSALFFCECVTASFKFVITLTPWMRKERLNGNIPLILEILYLTHQQVGAPLFCIMKVTCSDSKDNQTTVSVCSDYTSTRK